MRTSLEPKKYHIILFEGREYDLVPRDGGRKPVSKESPIKRGRKKKEESNRIEAAPEKKKRGRPAKNQLEMPKKRGRKPKIELVDNTEPKRRGRKPKMVAEPVRRGRGRPPKTEKKNGHKRTKNVSEAFESARQRAQQEVSANQD